MKQYAPAMSAIALVGMTALAQADETLKFRMIAHAVSAQSQEVGDVDGHVLTLSRFSGLASMPDGSIGQIGFFGQSDYIKGAGTFYNYNNLTLSDGSVLWYKTDGGKATMEGTTAKFSGPIVILGGKGRFEGAKGDGTATGARPTPLQTGANLYLDVTLNIKK